MAYATPLAHSTWAINSFYARGGNRSRIHSLARVTVSLAERALWPRQVGNVSEDPCSPSSNSIVCGRRPARVETNQQPRQKREASGGMRSFWRLTEGVPEGPAYPGRPASPILPETVVFEEVSCRCLDHSSWELHLFWP
jgi:hypothetical protein